MSKKEKEEKQLKKPPLGRVKNHLKMGIVGLPNVGKSSLYNLLTKTQAKAENYPFCTIEPNNARVPLPDERWNFLCQMFKPASSVPSYLEVWDIAGLVKGASKGEGLGNAFLSNIMSVDGIYHVVRIFEDADVTHVEGDIDPVRDLDIISTELRLKDIEMVEKKRTPLSRLASSDRTKRQELDMYDHILNHLQEGKDIRSGEWSAKEVELLNELLLITAKPVIFLINMSEQDYISKKNRWLGKVVQWIKTNSPEAGMIPFALTLEQTCFDMELEERTAYLTENKTQSQLDKIIQLGFSELSLINFFTCGADEVRAWPIMQGFTAPKAAGSIHTDFERCFIRAEVMAFNDLKTLGSEAEVKAHGKYRTEGKNYIVNDGDILFIKHNAGGAGKKK